MNKKNIKKICFFKRIRPRWPGLRCACAHRGPRPHCVSRELRVSPAHSSLARWETSNRGGSFHCLPSASSSRYRAAFASRLHRAHFLRLNPLARSSRRLAPDSATGIAHRTGLGGQRESAWTTSRMSHTAHAPRGGQRHRAEWCSTESPCMQIRGFSQTDCVDTRVVESTP